MYFGVYEHFLWSTSLSSCTLAPVLSRCRGFFLPAAFEGIGIAYLYSLTLRIDSMSIGGGDFFVDSDFPNDQHKLTPTSTALSMQPTDPKGKF